MLVLHRKVMMKNIPVIGFFVIFIVSFAFSCSCNAKSSDKVLLYPDMSIDELSDSTFFNNINCLIEYDDDVYMSIDQRMQIIRMDEDLNLLATIGHQGRGPQEMVYVNSFFVDNDTIFVGDPGKLAYMKFDVNGNFISTIEESRNKYTLDSRFDVDNGLVYFSKINLETKTSMALLNIEDDTYTEYGAFDNFGGDMKNHGQNRRHVFLYRNSIIAVPVSIPVIEVYDAANLQLVTTIELSDIPYVNILDVEAQNGQTISEPNMTYSLVSDAYLKDNQLYVLYYPPKERINPDEYPGETRAFVFEIGGDTITLKKQLCFEDNITRICVGEKYLYGAMASGGSLKRYLLN